MRFGAGSGVCGLTSESHGGGFPFQVDDIGPLETKDADRHRVKAYASLANFDDYALAKLVGVRT